MDDTSPQLYVFTYLGLLGLQLGFLQAEARP